MGSGKNRRKFMRIYKADEDNSSGGHCDICVWPREY
jgi:hypothetical protein